MKKIRRTTRTCRHEQQKTNICEKEIKRQELVKKKKKNQPSKRIQCICLFISCSFILFLTHSASYLEQNVVSRQRDRKKNQRRLKDLLHAIYMTALEVNF